MIRLHIIAEGYTEKAFVDEVLGPYLARRDVFVDARCVLTSQGKRSSKRYRGGLLNYHQAKKDIETWMKQDTDPACRFTTMFDLYGLPEDFPGSEEASKNMDPYERVRILEDALAHDIDDHRFIAYIQLHEFETLILVDPQKLECEYIEHDKAIRNLVQMVGQQHPELINNGRETAPSKRIIQQIPEYDKVTSGVSVTKQIGLERLREKCVHFHLWVTRLEQIETP